MLRFISRRVSPGGSSSSILGQSFRVVRPVVSTPRTGGEILHHPGAFGHVRNLCHLILRGRSASLRPTREVMASLLQPEVTMQIQSRLFSSDNGLLRLDLVNELVT